MRGFLSAGLTLVLSLALTQEGTAQSAEERVQIDYEAAKMALEQKRPEQALEKFEKVIATLGHLPDLLYLAAEAAFQAGKVERAQDLISATFAVADTSFKSSAAYKSLIALAAKIELEGPEVAAQAQGYWIDLQTSLMWLARGYGTHLTGEAAFRYCSDLVLAGYTDWTQPSIEELHGIFDASTADGSGPKIRNPLQLSSGGMRVWSGTPGKKAGSAWHYDFFRGSRKEAWLEDPELWADALCVRRIGS